MQDWRGLIAIARRRLWRQRLLDATSVPLLAAGAAAVVALGLGKAIPGVMPAWWITASVLGGVALLAMIARSLRRPPSDLSAAIEVDRVLGLRDRVSVALASEGRDDPFARAAVADALRATSGPAPKATLRRGLPAHAPRGWWWAIPAVVLAALVEWLVPAWSPEGAVAEGSAEEARETARQAIDELQASIAEQPELEAMLGEANAGESPSEDLFAELEDPEEIRLEAIRQVTALEERLSELLEGPEAMASEDLASRMSELDVPSEGASRDLALEMRLGNFQGASGEIEKLREKLERGEMTDAEREALAAELESLAAQLAALAQSSESLDDQLRAAGVDPALAGELTPEDLARLREALERMQSMSQEEREALMKAAQAARQASQQTKKMSESMRQMASQCKNPGQSGQGTEGEQTVPASLGAQAQQTLSEAEEMRAMLRQARAAQSQCQGRARGMGSQGFLRPGAGGSGQGAGMGGRGQGAGGEMPRTETETATEVVREGGVMRPGDVIARSLIEGEVTVGEAQVPLERIDRAAEASAPADAGAEDPVPPHLRDAHRHYFGELRRLVRPATPGAPTPPGGGSTPAAGGAAPTPKEPAKDSPKGSGS